MTAHSTITAWNYRSAVHVCPDCSGTGKVRAFRRATVNDPYPETDCDCGLGEHEPECPVCGFDQVVPGIDCLACETIALLHDKDFARFDPAKFAESIGHAVAARSVEEAL